LGYPVRAVSPQLLDDVATEKAEPLSNQSGDFPGFSGSSTRSKARLDINIPQDYFIIYNIVLNNVSYLVMSSIRVGVVTGANKGIGLAMGELHKGVL
jgi:hypothetical protein